MTDDRSSKDETVPALTIGGTPLTWTPLDDKVMGGKSKTNLLVSAQNNNNENKTLQFQGTIDTGASVGWASVRASLPPGGLSGSAEALRFTFVGDGKTYKVLLMDSEHEKSKDSSPLWEADLPTTAFVKETKTLSLLQDFKPSYMSRQLSDSEKAKHPMEPTKLSKIGFMLSSRLHNGAQNPVETYGQGVFEFALRVEDLMVVSQDSK